MSSYVLRTEFPTAEQVSAVRARYTTAEALMKSLATTRKAVGEAATGKASDNAQHGIAVMEEALRSDAAFWLKALAWHQEMHAAGETYRKTSPTLEDRKAAEDDLRAKTATMKATGKALADADNVLASAKWQLTAASEENLTQAQANVATAQTARDNAKIADDKAAKEFREAKAHLTDVNDRMKVAEQAYSEAVARATIPDVAVTGGGDEVPGAGTEAGSGPGAVTAGVPSRAGGPSKPAEAVPGSGSLAPAAAKPGGTPAGASKPTTTTAPAATPAAKTTETGSTGKDLGPFIAALKQQPTPSRGTGQAAQAAPVAAAAPSIGAGKPVTAGQGEGAGSNSGLDIGRPWDVPDIAAVIGDGGSRPDRPAAAATTTPAPSTTAAPASPAAAKLAGGAPSTPTTGTSVTGVTTGQDVSGRSTPTPSAYSPAPGGPATSTSAAHGGAGAGTPGAGTQTSRTGMGGMPMGMMPPMVPGAGGGGSSADRKQIEKAKVSDDVSLLNGEHSIAEAVPGGTVGQRRD